MTRMLPFGHVFLYDLMMEAAVHDGDYRGGEAEPGGSGSG